MDLSDRGISTKQHLTNLVQSIKEQPKNADLWGKYGHALLIEEYYNAAAKTYEQAHVLEPNKTKWLILKAVALTDTKAEHALELMKQAFILGASGAKVEYYLARLYEYNGDLKQAKIH